MFIFLFASFSYCSAHYLCLSIGDYLFPFHRFPCELRLGGFFSSPNTTNYKVEFISHSKTRVLHWSLRHLWFSHNWMEYISTKNWIQLRVITKLYPTPRYLSDIISRSYIGGKTKPFIPTPSRPKWSINLFLDHDLTLLLECSFQWTFDLEDVTFTHWEIRSMFESGAQWARCYFCIPKAQTSLTLPFHKFSKSAESRTLGLDSV